ncbi:hypothetical protein [Xinfangfangia pollutisoli]|uniref:hypothetical protein n=1 Tax=Xinfangfangia pollutisoli TaxID=2865960 RepID=UPI001CD5F927|nr:hypothetical protein [Xinfangfangia pollutisoli]
MDFPQKVKDLAQRSRHAAEHALTEEGTKTAVLLPLIQTLGFDVFNLNEVPPEFIADVGTKKGEKIDFALKIDAEKVETKYPLGDLNQIFSYAPQIEQALSAYAR